MTASFLYARGLAVPKSLAYDHAAIDSLSKLGVEIFDKVDRQSFIAIATPIQDEQAQALGPYAVQLLQLTRKLAA